MSKLKRSAINDEGKLDSDASSEEFTVKPQKVEEGEYLTKPINKLSPCNLNKKSLAHLYVATILLFFLRPQYSLEKDRCV